jgi:uncharacterized protein with ParB-like and HNH nuclease domain
VSYKSDSIATILNQLNVKYFLPAIQREYVWQPDQVIKLFDSIMRGYPISSFLFWELQNGNYDKWEIYKFIDSFKPGDHNQPANTSGVQQLTLVLDGQQRLTSLLIGLKGFYTIKIPKKFWNNPNAWKKQQLFLNLLKDPGKEDDFEDNGIRYGFSFFEAPPANDSTQHWIQVGQIMKYNSTDAFDKFKDDEEEKLPEAVTKKEIKLFQHNLDRLYKAIWNEDFISYYVEHDQSYDRVLDIFVRANEGGTKLGKSDLLLSMVTSKWGGVNAREEIFNFVDLINEDLTRKNNFDKDFVMKACLVLTDLPVAYRVENFNNKNLELIRSKWESIKKAIQSTVEFINFFGIDENSLTSANALIPIAYYLYRYNIKTLVGSGSFESVNAAIIRRWLTLALLNKVFSGQSDNVLRQVRAAIQEQELSNRNFPLEPVEAALSRAGRATRFTSANFDEILQTGYGQRETFLTLTLLYDEFAWGAASFHQDHIFPRALFTPNNLKKAGIPESNHQSFMSQVNRIGNLQLILASENLEKSDNDFETWLAKQGDKFRQKHLIPEDNNLLKLQNFERFVEARENLIRERLSSLFEPAPVTI